ncbi:hypothetical protein BpHYR1_013891 [Brachionus plicatilis]|uniref:Uncharacterized protein n=1 Tax=Brachionus plicatilis TaxID=10195 RepID=A0A3M7QWA5_BRAPC|nr:hypothetical protein BpHYR1_013891 [Brachionus plicatilis]
MDQNCQWHHNLLYKLTIKFLQNYLILPFCDCNSGSCKLPCGVISRMPRSNLAKLPNAAWPNCCALD